MYFRQQLQKNMRESTKTMSLFQNSNMNIFSAATKQNNSIQAGRPLALHVQFGRNYNNYFDPIAFFDTASHHGSAFKITYTGSKNKGEIQRAKEDKIRGVVEKFFSQANFIGEMNWGR